GEALAGFVLVALLHSLLKGLDALLERVEQLAEALLAGLGEALLALVEDLPGQLGELRAQLVAGALQVAQALLVMLLLLTQLGGQGGALALQLAQLTLLLLALAAPVLGRLLGHLALAGEQLVLPAQGRQLGLLLAVLLLQATQV